MQVVWTGGSAGGLAVYLNADHVAARLPGVSVKALADGGFFMDHRTFEGADYARQIYSTGFMDLWESASTANRACIASNPTAMWKCAFAQYTLPHIATPVYVVEGMYDPWQLEFTLQVSRVHTTHFAHTPIILLSLSRARALALSKPGFLPPPVVLNDSQARRHLGDLSSLMVARRTAPRRTPSASTTFGRLDGPQRIVPRRSSTGCLRLDATCGATSRRHCNQRTRRLCRRAQSTANRF
jgi:hypothetical protein